MLCSLNLLLDKLTHVMSRDIAERAVVQYVERLTKTVYERVENGQRKKRRGDAHFDIAGTPRIRNVPDVVKALKERALQGEP